MIDIFHLFHVLHVLPNYSMFSYLRWQDGTTWGAQLPVEEPPSVFFTVNDLPAVVSGDWMGTTLRGTRNTDLKDSMSALCNPIKWS